MLWEFAQRTKEHVVLDNVGIITWANAGASVVLGAGLAPVSKIVELHDGSVQARSEDPNLGGQFVVRFPSDVL